MGGAHRHAEESIKAVGKSIEAMLKELDGKDGKMLVQERRTKFLEMGRKGLAA
jgi:acetyl-CoA carboxylase carboxyl transferase subunit alpha